MGLGNTLWETLRSWQPPIEEARKAARRSDHALPQVTGGKNQEDGRLAGAIPARPARTIRHGTNGTANGIHHGGNSNFASSADISPRLSMMSRVFPYHPPPCPSALVLCVSPSSPLCRLPCSPTPPFLAFPYAIFLLPSLPFSSLCSSCSLSSHPFVAAPCMCVWCLAAGPPHVCGVISHW